MPLSTTLGLHHLRETTLASSRPLSVTLHPSTSSLSFPFCATLPFDRIRNVKTCRGLPFTCRSAALRMPEIARPPTSRGKCFSIAWRLRVHCRRNELTVISSSPRLRSFGFGIRPRRFRDRVLISRDTNIDQIVGEKMGKGGRENSLGWKEFWKVRCKIYPVLAAKCVYIIDVIFTGRPATCLLSKTHSAASICCLGKLPH